MELLPITLLENMYMDHPRIQKMTTQPYVSLHTRIYWSGKLLYFLVPVLLHLVYVSWSEVVYYG